MVVIGEVLFGKIENGFLLQRLNKCHPQLKNKRSIEIRLAGRCDTCCFLRAFKTELPLMLALVQIIDSRHRLQKAERRMGWASGEGIDLIREQIQARGWSQIGSGLLRSKLVHANLPSLKSRIRSLKSGSNLLPGEGLLSESAIRQAPS